MESEKDKINIPYTYDTPTGIIKKEGDFFRGMATPKTTRPRWVRILAVVFALLFLILPGISYITLVIILKETPLISMLLGIAFGLINIGVGGVIVYKNIK